MGYTMSYRDIIVENKRYRYVVGKEFVKIQDCSGTKPFEIIVAQKSQVGIPTPGPSKWITYYEVTPATIAALIKGEPVPVIPIVVEKPEQLLT